MEPHQQEACAAESLRFIRRNWVRILICSAVLLIPCFWHKRIEAGDLGSHVYNAWLAQLIEHGQAPGLHFAKQWNNVLFDWLLLAAAKTFGLAAAQKIVVSVCVLIFFWGAFALVATVARRAPWFLLPCFLMLAYGWTFNIGFFNYYVSLGLGFFATAILWGWLEPDGLSGGRMRPIPMADVVCFLLLAALVLVAHPQGFVWLAGSSGYIALWSLLRGRLKLLVPGAAVVFVFAARHYLMTRYDSGTVWDTFGAGIYNGSDQLALYGMHYYFVLSAALILGVICFGWDRMRGGARKRAWCELRLPLELHWFVVLAVYVLPDVLRVPWYAGWIGSLAVRLTTVAAVFGLCVLAAIQPRPWHTAAFSVVAAAFFGFLYRDTATLNRMEAQIERLVGPVPYGERVTATIWAPADSRIPYLQHLMDRACVGHCFSFQNYEPASRQFRIRVDEDGSPMVTDDPDLSQQMEAGEYVVQPQDLPMAQIYQCDERDLTRLCIRQLSANEVNGRVGYHPPRD